MLNIYLARHGQDEDNLHGILNGRRDMPLTEKGLEQAGLVAEELLQTDIKIDKIYASPLQRAYQTAEVIADTLGAAKPEKLEDLTERDFGIMTGKPQADIEKLCVPDILKTATVTYFLRPDGAETFPQLIDRAGKVIRFITANHHEGNILLVSHGDIGKMIYCAYYHLNWREILTMFHFGNSEILTLSPASDPKDIYLIRAAQYNL